MSLCLLSINQSLSNDLVIRTRNDIYGWYAVCWFNGSIKEMIRNSQVRRYGFVVHVYVCGSGGGAPDPDEWVKLLIIQHSDGDVGRRLRESSHTLSVPNGNKPGDVPDPIRRSRRDAWNIQRNDGCRVPSRDRSSFSETTLTRVAGCRGAVTPTGIR